ncbi:MAG: DUF4271 domain-containing protein [Saprospiraceae bacterium]
MRKKVNKIRIISLVFVSFFLCTGKSVVAQYVTNPFDLGRPEPIVSDSTTIATKPTSSIGNPFELSSDGSVATTPEAPTIVEKIPVLLPASQIEKPQQFLFVIILAVLFLLTVLVSVSRSLIKKIYQAFFNDIVLKSLYREKGSLNTSIYLSLYGMFIINLGIFIYLLLRHYGLLIRNSDMTTLLWCILGVFSLIVAKHIVLAILSLVFPISKEIDIYSFVILIFGILTGLVLAPANVFLAYADPEFAKLIIFGTLIFILLFYTVLSLRSLFLARNYITVHFFHFLLYLCAIEVVPLLLLYKFITVHLQMPILY